jgi:FHA domain/Zinc-ribbon containing domain
LLSVVTEHHESGAVPGGGTFACLECTTSVSLEALDQLPHCPRCGGALFRRASLFEAANTEQPTAEFAPEVQETPPGWLDGVRSQLPRAGRYLAYWDDGAEAVALERGWTRIGRSVAADLRLDDPTVSRRHALVVWEGDEPLRVLDDRSLNGVFLNGQRIEWGTMADGDELAIGRYRLHLIER